MTKILKKIKFDSLNYVLTYKSPYKNLRVNFSDEEATDYIIQNYLGLVIYVEKTEKDCNITVTKYPSKFSFFGAGEPYIFNSLFNYAQIYLIKKYGYNLNNYENLPQINIRFNSKALKFFEFFNFYLNQLNLKIDFYIRQIYGGSELYECNADDFDQKNLMILTSPISNIKCKNKTSLFNRLFSLNGTKIISGYIAHDSEFDIYAEIQNDENTFINVSHIITQDSESKNNAKYLKKNIKYTINFFLNHLIKLEPGFDVEIVITNGKNSSIINKKKPTAEIYGEGYSIKANNECMVYFLQRLPDDIIQQEIDIEKIKGKILNISYFNRYVNGFLLIEFGFKNYWPLNVQNKVNIWDYIYYDDIYEKRKVELVQDEKLYIYTEKRKLNIDYIDNNLNYANNDYNIFLISPNNENNSIIINFELDNFDDAAEITPDIHFCQKDTKIFLSLETYKKTNYTFEKSDDIPFVFELYNNGDNKFTFNTNKPVVFTYSIHDTIDKKLFEGKSEYAKERKVLNDLKIEEISDLNNNTDIIKIKFKANYLKSSTRYIIIITAKNNNNNLNSLKDACHVVSLLKQKHQEVKTEAIYNVGENELIGAEVDISEILNNNNEYIMSIISQELRFEKKIKFYEPKEFVHSAHSVIPDPDPKKSDDNDDSGLKGTSLALAIILPIFGIIIIGLIVIIILKKCKGYKSEDIEKLESLTALH